MSAARPYVDRPVTDRERAADVASVAAETWNLPAPRFLRLGMNALFACGDVVVRVGSSTAPAAASHALVRWLLDHDIPTIRPVDDLAADIDGFAVTGWHTVRETRRAVDWVEIGTIVRRVHDLPLGDVPVGYPVPDPTMFPWWQFDELLDEVGETIDPPALSGLRAAVARHAGWQERVRRGQVLCHGDVHPGNVLMSGAGPLLVDWDLLCAANPAWDMAVLTVGARWGRDPAEFDRFRAGYRGAAERKGDGPADLDDLDEVDDLARALGELRNVAATLMRVKAGRTDAAAADEAQRRLRFWRGEPDAPTWHAQ